MKRTTMSVLGALTVAVGLTVVATPAAQAQSTVVCNTYPAPPIADTPAVNINNWPRVKVNNSNPAISHLYYCINGGNPATDSQFAVAWQAAQSIGTTGSNVPPPYDTAELFYNAKLRIYFFENLVQLNSYWGTNYAASANGGEPSAFTLGAGDPHNPNIPVGSIGILKKKANGTVNVTNTIKGNVYHELGHAFDRLKGNPSATAGSRWYKAQSSGGILRTDVAGLNILSRATAFATVSASTIAPCQAKYNDEVTYTNWQVAQCIWPYQTDYKAGASAPLYQGNSQEFYANVFAVIVGGLLWDQNDNRVLYDLGAFIADNFGSGESNNYFRKSTAPLGVLYGGTP